jgi:hypothetical protein
MIKIFLLIEYIIMSSLRKTELSNEVREKLEALLNQSGGLRKKKASKKVSKKASKKVSKKASKKQHGGGRGILTCDKCPPGDNDCRQICEEPPAEGGKPKSKKASKKVSKKVSKKGSKKMHGGDAEPRCGAQEGGKKHSKKASKKSSKKISKKGSKKMHGGRGANPAMQAGIDFRAFIAKDSGLKQGVPMVRLVSFLVNKVKESQPDIKYVDAIAEAKKLYLKDKEAAIKKHKEFVEGKLSRSKSSKKSSKKASKKSSKKASKKSSKKH